MFIFLLCMAALIPAIMIFSGIPFKHRPPKRIDGICGYRTNKVDGKPADMGLHAGILFYHSGWEGI